MRARPSLRVLPVALWGVACLVGTGRLLREAARGTPRRGCALLDAERMLTLT